MNEPFTMIPFNAKVKDSRGKEVPNFRIEDFSHCFFHWWQDMKNPNPITESMSNLLDAGSKVKNEENILSQGARNLITAREELKMVHSSKKFTISGCHDKWKYDFRGEYFEDIKSTHTKGLLYFLERDIKEDYYIKLSLHAYMKYVQVGIYCDKGVVTMIDRSDPRNRVSRSLLLWTQDEIRDYLMKHPVLLCVLGKITVAQLIQESIAQVGKEKWKCRNCQYRDGEPNPCPIYHDLEIGRARMVEMS